MTTLAPTELLNSLTGIVTHQETWSPAWLVLAGTAIIGLLVFQKTSTKPDKED